MAFLRHGFVACALAFCTLAFAQGFPQPGKTIRMVVPTPPGGTTDIQARLIAPRLGDALGMAVVVDNKPGASTIIGAQDVARAAPDGLTLLYTFSTTHVQVPHLFAKAPYDAIRDFTPITQVASASNILTVHESVPARNVRELVAYARANPGKLNFASFSPGSSSHLQGELLKLEAKIDIHHIPYKGSGDAIKDLLGGTVQIMFDGATTAIANAKSGRVRILAVTSQRRLAVLPEVPTMTEEGYPGIIGGGYLGVFGPAGMPAATLKRLNAELVKIVRTKEVSDALTQGGTEPTGTSPEEFAAIVRELHASWGSVIKRVGVKLD